MKPLLTAIILARALDAATTITAMQGGAHEANPLMPGRPGVNVAVVAGVTAGEVLWLKHLKTEHPKLARGIAWTILAAEGIAIAQNARTLHAQR